MDAIDTKPQALPALRQRLTSRLPSWGQILPVFSTIVFVVFSWTIYHLFWQMASWLYTLSLLNVLILAAYILSFALVESLALLGVLFALSLIFPPRTFRDKFIEVGIALLLLFSVGAILMQGRLEIIPKMDLQMLLGTIVLGLLAITICVDVTSWLIDRIPFLSRQLNGFADRMTVFTYIYVPLSLAGWVVVILRNLF